MFVSEELYLQILRVMPIPCVDLLIVDDAGDVLLLLRRNEPAAGQWWFPGGRVFFGELRRDAAKRKLEQECGLSSTQFQELGTFDVLLGNGPNQRSHAITTLFKVRVASGHYIRTDPQSSEACWLTPRKWLDRGLHPFVCKRLEEVAKS
ncbi:MAG TPA: NUDIX domain-containing protein [Burkholderiales bacterium]|nr:NUDIX domain-containing protein [Burkholderiales bacterium]